MEHRKERIDRGIKARTEDIYALFSYREMLYLLVPRAIPILVLFLVTLLVGVYWQKVLISTAVFALLALSWDLLTAAGMVSLGQALFFGIGAYITGILNHYFNLSPLFTIPIATVG